ncbi:MAG: SIS domain-containing protein [Bacteroidota bacterium]
MTEKDSLDELTGRIPALESCKKEIGEAAVLISGCFENGGKLLLCGNGGSCADADHMVGELMKSFEKKRSLPEDLKKRLRTLAGERGAYLADHLQEAFPAISLCAHSSLLTAISNDMDADLVFAQQVAAYGVEGDVLLAISTSGNSRNVRDAALSAKAKGMTVIGLTGRSGGILKPYCDVSVCVPAERTADVQEYHLPVYHTICRMIENRLI